LDFPGALFVKLEEFDVLADPQSITYAAAAKSLPAVGRSDSASEYKLNDSGTVYDLTVSHQFKTRNRVVARLRRDSAVTDPLIPAQNILASMTASFTMDFPTAGLSATDAQSLAKALVAWLTDATLLKLANGET
jgi:hypothetical protein